MVADTCNLSTQEGEAGGLTAGSGKLVRTKSETLSQQNTRDRSVSCVKYNETDEVAGF